MYLKVFKTLGQIQRVTRDYIAHDIYWRWRSIHNTNKMNLIYVLDGAINFKKLLVKELKREWRSGNLGEVIINEFPLKMKTYEGTKHKHECKIEGVDSAMRATFDFDAPFLIVDDILDTGYTIDTIIDHLITKLKLPKKAKPITNDNITVATLVKKFGSDKRKYGAYLCGFETEEFVVGFGMDLNGKFRSIDRILTLHNYTDKKTRTKCFICDQKVTIVDHIVDDIKDFQRMYPDAEITDMTLKDINYHSNKPICMKCWGQMVERAYSTYEIAFK